MQTIKLKQYFSSSVEATEFVDQLQAMLADPRLQDWCATQDSDYGTEACGALAQAAAQFAKVVHQLEQAE